METTNVKTIERMLRHSECLNISLAIHVKHVFLQGYVYKITRSNILFRIPNINKLAKIPVKDIVSIIF